MRETHCGGHVTTWSTSPQHLRSESPMITFALDLCNWTKGGYSFKFLLLYVQFWSSCHALAAAAAGGCRRPFCRSRLIPSHSPLAVWENLTPFRVQDPARPPRWLRRVGWRAQKIKCFTSPARASCEHDSFAIMVKSLSGTGVMLIMML